jgi:hypothetical protein
VYRRTINKIFISYIVASDGHTVCESCFVAGFEVCCTSEDETLGQNWWKNCDGELDKERQRDGLSANAVLFPSNLSVYGRSCFTAGFAAERPRNPGCSCLVLTSLKEWREEMRLISFALGCSSI